MADTGWVRFTSVVDPLSDYEGESNLIFPNTGEAYSNGDNNDRIVLTNLSSLGIPSGSTITGVAYKFRAKKTTDSPQLNTRLGYDAGFTITGDTDTQTLTDSYVDYEIGGDGETLGLKNALIDVGSDLGVQSLKLEIKQSGTGIVYLEGTSESPAVKIFYTPPPEGTSVSDWTRFTTLDSSDGFNSGDTNLASPNEGIADWLSPSSNPYFIGSGFDFGIPSNATVVGIQYLTVIKAHQFGLASNQVWNGKLSTDPFSEGDITDEFFTIAPTDYDTTDALYSTGSFDNTFGLTLTGVNVNDLKLGFKVSSLGGGAPFPYGSILGEEGNGTSVFFPTPVLRVFYTTPEPTPTPTLEPKFAVRSSGFYVRESSF